ncbi:MAG: methyltransferase domain-containing protein [Lachnospiraceae bacterium]
MEEQSKKCRLCKNQLKERNPILQFHNMPSIAQNFPTKDQLGQDCGIDFSIYQCPYCGLIQILEKPVSYYKDVIRAVAVSQEMAEFRKVQFEKFLRENQLIGKRIIEIGAGAGEYMTLMEAAGAVVYGIEHRNTSVSAGKEKGLTLYQGYISSKEYAIGDSPFDGFYCMNYLEHVPELNEFLQGINYNLTEGGIGLIEVPNTDRIIQDAMFSEFMLDHLSYFTQETLKRVVEQNGFKVKSCEVVWNEYMISMVVEKRRKIDGTGFQKGEQTLIKEVNAFIEDMNVKGKKVAVWGAGHEALSILAIAQLRGRIDGVIDSADFKQNKYTPATHIPIYSPDRIKEQKIEAILVIAGSFTNEVCRIIKGINEEIICAIIEDNKIKLRSRE